MTDFDPGVRDHRPGKAGAEMSLSVEVTTLAELKTFQRRVLIQDLAKILKVTVRAGSQRQLLRRLFVIAGITPIETKRAR